VKTTIIALSAAALIAAAPAVPAQGASRRTPGPQHEVSSKHQVSGHARPRETQAKGAGKGSLGAFGYAPGQHSGFLDRDLEVSGRQAGGGGSGM
jgi:predicted Zn-dependent protease